MVLRAWCQGSAGARRFEWRVAKGQRHRSLRGLVVLQPILQWPMRLSRAESDATCRRGRWGAPTSGLTAGQRRCTMLFSVTLSPLAVGITSARTCDRRSWRRQSWQATSRVGLATDGGPRFLTAAARWAPADGQPLMVRLLSWVRVGQRGGIQFWTSLTVLIAPGGNGQCHLHSQLASRGTKHVLLSTCDAAAHRTSCCSHPAPTAPQCSILSILIF